MCGIWGLLSLREITLDSSLLYSKFNQIKSRGPDTSTFITKPNYIVGFHRLSIMDLSTNGSQPFVISYKYTSPNNSQYIRTIYLCVNGEIYNWEKLRSDPDIIEYCEKTGYKWTSNSDCEVLLVMFMKYINMDIYSQEYESIESNGLSEMIKRLDGEFAFAIYDIHEKIGTDKKWYNLWMGRDRFGIRPAFYSMLDDQTIAFGSELKSLIGIDTTKNNKIEQIDPRSWYYWGGLGLELGADQDGQSNILKSHTKFYYSVGALPIVRNPDPIDVYRTCRTLLTQSVVDRLSSDRDIGCLLSGGLDSSLVAALAAQELAKRNQVLHTFSIGMENSPDVKYAKIVSKHIGSSHTNFEIPSCEWIEAINQVIKIAETYDITTVRATVGQYLISKKIRETTNIKVLLVGDGSDEATGGYLYFHKAPNPMALHFETQKLLHYIHYFDVLRADRGIASNGLEARVPFLSHNFVNFYFQVDPILRTCKSHTNSLGETKTYEKYLLRKSWDKTGLLPESVLWRRKEAFSDGVSCETKSWYQIVQENVEKLITDEYFDKAVLKYKNNNQHIIPHTKEALWYMEQFEELYPSQLHIIPYYWMPKWIENPTDPSARTLEIYSQTNSITNSNNSMSNYNAVSIIS